PFPPSFFTLSRDPPELHSFPTRRSSDLCPGTWRQRERCAQEGDVGNRDETLYPASRTPLPGPAGSSTCGMSHEHRDVACYVSISDRKSTRLNSSHVAISYAVFCLKKKIE